MKKISKEMQAGVALSLSACFMLFLYSPLETYLTNVGEFWFDIYILFPPIMFVFVVFLGISIALLSFIKVKWSSKAYYFLILTYFLAFVCTYVQGTFLAKSLPILNGQWIVWSDYPLERIKCITLWVLFGGAVIVIHKLFNKEHIYTLIKIVSICMFLMFAVTLFTLMIFNDGLAKKAKVSSTTYDMFTMSEDINYIIFCLDSVSTYDFMKAYDKHPEWAEIFGDFTWYSNTFGVYPCTRFTVPFFFSGQWYEGEEPYEDWQIRAYLDSPILSRFESENYNIGIYISDEIMPKVNEMTRFNNIIDNSYGSYGVNDYWDFIRWNIQIVGFRYAPFDLKRICFVDPHAFNGLKLLPEGYVSHTGKDDEFYDLIKNETIKKINDRVFKYIHIDGAHPPFYFDENVNRINDATYESSIEASITITEAYLDKLKENDMYDNSVIVVLSDHGWDTGDNEDNALRQQTPILFIKGIGESHALEVSQAPISYVDLQEAFFKLLEGNAGDEVFIWKEGDERERRLLFINGQEHKGDIVYEWIQSGQSWNPDTVTKNEVTYTIGE